MNKGISLQEFIAYKNNFPAGASMIVVGDRAFRPVTHVFTGFLNQLVDGEMILASDKKDGGMRTITGNFFPVGVDFFGDAARFTFDCSAGVQAAGIKTANFGKTDAPVAFKNALVTFNQGATLAPFSGSDLVNSKASTGADSDYRDFKMPIKFRNNIEFSIKASLAGVAAADQAYKLEIRGWEEVAPASVN